MDSSYTMTASLFLLLIGAIALVLGIPLLLSYVPKATNLNPIMLSGIIAFNMCWRIILVVAGGTMFVVGVIGLMVAG